MMRTAIGILIETTIDLTKKQTAARNAPLMLGVTVSAFPGRPLIYAALVIGMLVEFPHLTVLRHLLLKQVPSSSTVAAATIGWPKIRKPIKGLSLYAIFARGSPIGSNLLPRFHKHVLSDQLSIQTPKPILRLGFGFAIQHDLKLANFIPFRGGRW